MRPAQKSNRSRGRGNRKSGGGGGNNINRVYDSAGPEGKVRGTPQQIIDKYTTLARDAQTSGDRVAAENFLQHAEHYQRLLIQAMGAQEQNKREQAASNSEDQSSDQQADQETEDSSQTTSEDVAQPGAEQPDIGGMAMIDSGQAQPDLLVEPEEMVRSQPKRNARRRPQPEKAEPVSKTKNGAADAPDGADSDSEGTSQATESKATEAKPAEKVVATQKAEQKSDPQPGDGGAPVSDQTATEGTA